MNTEQILTKKLFGKSILVAEDVELNQHLTKHILESCGASVVIASNGNEALLLLSQHSFDCILMDVQMPEMDGIQATMQIRQLADPVSAAIPIIALTANVHTEDLQKYRQAGMNDYLAKPFDESRLLSAILKNEAIKQADELAPVVPALYDLTMIKTISGGDPVFLRKMILLFIDTVPQNVRELVEATRTENWLQVSKMAHKLKSTVDSMGIKSLREKIRTVESNAKLQEHCERIPPMVYHIESVIQACIEQLKTEV